MGESRDFPLWNNALSVDERLDAVLSELTLEEKFHCLTTGIPDIERLGIKASFVGGEAAHGIQARHDQAFDAGEPEPTTSFTQPIGMSGSFDTELIRECGRAVGEEARALYRRNHGGSLCRWAPTIDMERDPRWGRTEEAYGEDPCLTGKMASAYIQGMKGNDPFYIQCAATLKHFYANNVEKNRVSTSSSLDERNKHEYYLEPFRRAVTEGGAEAVMTSYNEINGVPAVVNHEVQELLKDEWKLPGHVVCDGGDFQQTVQFHHYFTTHTESLAYGLKAGIDAFTDDPKVVYQAARDAYEQGLITEEDIDRALRNSFRTRIRLGLFDGNGDCPYSEMGEEYVNNADHQETCRKMAEESVVLLKNEGILPWKKEAEKSESQDSTRKNKPQTEDQIHETIAVAGPLADVWYKDWYSGVPPYAVTPVEGIRREFPQAEVTCHNGLSKIRLSVDGKYVALDADNRLYLGEKAQAETFLYTDWGCGNTTLQAMSNDRFVILEEGSYLITASSKEAFHWFIREQWDFQEQPDGSYLLNSWNGRQVTADPDGYLAVIKNGDVAVGEGDDEKLGLVSHAVSEGDPIRIRMEIVEDGLKEVLKLVEKAEKAVVVLGSNPVINSKEEIDRTTLALPPAQQRLADEVLKIKPDTVIVLVTNYPYSIVDLNTKAKAILYTASGSQELGTGIGAVLSGRTNPAARLPMTWYQRDEDLPDINDYDIIKGKRTYQYFDGKVLYPFGYGLSYTKFRYGEMDVEEKDDEIRILLPITNTGDCEGDEVVQLYIHKEDSRVVRPIRQLKDFVRVKNLKPGETRVVMLSVKKEDLRYYDVISRQMMLEDGGYLFEVGASSVDIRQSRKLVLKGERAGVRNPFAVTEAIQYDDYTNCFIHKGTLGHAEHGETCLIPGRPGEAPDEIPRLPDGKVKGELIYRDFSFERQASKFKFTACVLEEARIRVLSEDENHRNILVDRVLPLPEKKGFRVYEAALEEKLPELSEAKTITIQLEGRVKLKEFEFV